MRLSFNHCFAASLEGTPCTGGSMRILLIENDLVVAQRLIRTAFGEASKPSPAPGHVPLLFNSE